METEKKIIERLDRIVELTDSMQNRLDSLLKSIEKSNDDKKMITSFENSFNKNRIVENKHPQESNIMNKFNDWMLRKDPKNDMSTFDKTEGDEDNF